MGNMNIYHNQPEGIWIINEEENGAFRIMNGEKSVDFPITSEILATVKKQIEASKYFSLFLGVDIKNEMMIGYLYFMLDDYYNYLSVEEQQNFLKRVKMISESDYVDMMNASYLKNIYTNLLENNLEEFDYSFEQFRAYNSTNFEQILHANSEKEHYSL